MSDWLYRSMEKLIKIMEISVLVIVIGCTHMHLFSRWFIVDILDICELFLTKIMVNVC